MVYGLTNKETGKVRYVGRTQKPLGKRLASHRYTARERREDTPKDRWMRQVGEKQIGIVKLENDCENNEKAELWWMDYLEFLGCELLNVIREPIGGKVGQSGLEVTDEVKELMGTMPDRELGEKLGFATNTIAKHRNRHGIEAFGNNGGHQLSEELIEQLGKKSDAELGRKFGYSKGVIKAHREKKGIKPFEVFEYDLPGECYELMGEIPDGEVADQFGTSRITIRRRRNEYNIDAYTSDPVPKKCIKNLGEKPDYKLAKEYSVGVNKLREIRREKGITSYKGKKLSKKDAREIKWLVENSNLKYKDIGDRYEIAPSSISRVANDEYFEENVNPMEPLKQT